MAAVELRNVTVSFRRGEAGVVHALDRVSLSVQPGEFVSVVGRAGSGKTTLLHCAGLLRRPTSGEVIVDGIDAGALADGERADLRGRRIGFVFQDGNLLPALTVLENVLLPLRYAGLPAFRGSARRRALDLLDLVEIPDLGARRPAQLDAGQVQRAALARALVRAPALVLADEPTGEVANETSDELLYLMLRINRMSDVAFVVATHDVEVASCMDRMIRISDGQVTSDVRLRVDRDHLRDVR